MPDPNVESDRQHGRDVSGPLLPRVVIIGGGFAGIAAARELRDAQAQVVVVDRVNHQLFQPLLYQVAGCMLTDGDIAAPIRELLSSQANTVVALAEVTGLDPAKRQVYLDRYPDRPFDYDCLVVAAGVETSYFGHDEWAHFAPGMKTLEEGIALRSRILEAFELAELQEDPEALPELTTFVIVGGGRRDVNWPAPSPKCSGKPSQGSFADSTRPGRG